MGGGRGGWVFFLDTGITITNANALVNVLSSIT